MKKRISRRLMAFLLLAVMLITAVPVVSHASSTQITGRSTVAQTVYSGPSSSYYTSIGSISPNETVYVLGKEKGLGWYHIQYWAGSNQKSGYVPTNTITAISGGTPGEEEFYGGYAHSNANQTVWSCDDPSFALLNVLLYILLLLLLYFLNIQALNLFHLLPFALLLCLFVSFVIYFFIL